MALWTPGPWDEGTPHVDWDAYARRTDASQDSIEDDASRQGSIVKKRVAKVVEKNG